MSDVANVAIEADDLTVRFGRRTLVSGLRSSRLRPGLTIQRRLRPSVGVCGESMSRLDAFDTLVPIGLGQEPAKRVARLSGGAARPGCRDSGP